MTQDIKVVDREAEIIFHNWTDEDYDGMWNKRIYRLQANKSYYLPFYLAEHFAQGLVTRELNKRAAAAIAERRKSFPSILPRDQEQIETPIIGNLVLRQDLMDKCVEIPKENQDVRFVTPKEVPMREVKLRTQARTEDYVNQGRIAPGEGAQRKPVTDGTVATDAGTFEKS